MKLNDVTQYNLQDQPAAEHKCVTKVGYHAYLKSN